MTDAPSHAQDQPPLTPNPALQSLAALAGNWEMELSNASFLPDPSATFRGSASVEWLEEGALLALRQGSRPTAPFAIWVIGRDEAAKTYTVLYFDDRGVSRIYAMSFYNGVWKMWREAPGFSQRFTATVSPDGNRISGKWEKSSDGQRWEHDFDLIYTRLDKEGAGRS